MQMCRKNLAGRATAAVGAQQAASAQVQPTPASPPDIVLNLLLELRSCCAHRDFGKVYRYWEIITEKVEKHSARGIRFEVMKAPSKLLENAVVATATVLQQLFLNCGSGNALTSSSTSPEEQHMSKWKTEKIYATVLRVAAASLENFYEGAKNDSFQQPFQQLPGSRAWQTSAGATSPVEVEDYARACRRYIYVQRVTCALHALRAHMFAIRAAPGGRNSVDEERFLLLWCAAACREMERLEAERATSSWSTAARRLLEDAIQQRPHVLGNVSSPFLGWFLSAPGSTTAASSPATTANEGFSISAPSEDVKPLCIEMMAFVLHQTGDIWQSRHFKAHLGHCFHVSPLDFVFLLLDVPPLLAATPSKGHFSRAAGGERPPDHSARLLSRVLTVLMRVEELAQQLKLHVFASPAQHIALLIFRKAVHNVQVCGEGSMRESCFRGTCLPIAAFFLSKLHKFARARGGPSSLAAGCSGGGSGGLAPVPFLQNLAPGTTTNASCFPTASEVGEFVSQIVTALRSGSFLLPTSERLRFSDSGGSAAPGSAPFSIPSCSAYSLYTTGSMLSTNERQFDEYCGFVFGMLGPDLLVAALH
eukprot:g16558.t1